MNPIPPHYFYTAFADKKYIGMVQAVGKRQARARVITDWKNAAPQMVKDIESGKIRLSVRRTGIKKVAKREASNIPSQPEKTGIFKVFTDKMYRRMENDDPNIRKPR